MSLPIRCFTCGKVINRKEEEYERLLESGVSEKDTLDRIGMTRYCCRRMFLGGVNILDKLLLIPDNVPGSLEKKSESKTE